jgi:hypothetical protein
LENVAEALKGVNVEHLIQVIFLALYRGQRFDKIFKNTQVQSAMATSIQMAKVWVPYSGTERSPPLGKFRIQSIMQAFPHITCAVCKYMSDKRDMFPRPAEFFPTDIEGPFQWPGSIVVYWAYKTKGAKDGDLPGIIARNVKVYVDWFAKYMGARSKKVAGTSQDKKEYLNLVQIGWLGKSISQFSLETAGAVCAGDDGKIVFENLFSNSNNVDAVKKELKMDIFAQPPRPKGDITSQNLQALKDQIYFK